ncbi:ornithine monooxygenase [Pseudomonas lactis]|uniref:lysine N(6)-hydroxylase/L-ornithine N(5)-oxygenase family protein n=1 Tax=Pseudomonas lactis TaxID=1615674 RepID=UPI000B75B96F|nr:SidA/IucD/PvdA family monooxygenase [Pseudomonas lactis]OWQ38570.1 ornithine monooxygenase [Pseudomonas lactis]
MPLPQEATPSYDLIGIGFGPSNLALAIALDELKTTSTRAFNVVFYEKQKQFNWHSNTLTPHSKMQISFLKDLVSLRNPTSPFSFINYLHQKERLVEFINLGQFHPSRLEYNDYLKWVSTHFSERCIYGEQALRVEPQIGKTGEIELLDVISRDRHGHQQTRQTKSLVLSLGGTPRIPSAFKLTEDNPRVFHHCTYLHSLQRFSHTYGQPRRVAVIGAGQSAAEAFIDLHDRFPSAHIDLIIRGSSLKPSDQSPFVNEIFAPRYTDFIYNKSVTEREKLISEFNNTNYSVIDIDLIERIYSILYHQQVSGEHRHTLLKHCSTEHTRHTEDSVALLIKNHSTGESLTKEYDLTVLATGYERSSHREALAPLADYLGDFKTTRNYRLETDKRLKSAIYLQGFNESSHGLSDSLLSILPFRAQEIAKELYEYALERPECQTIASV